MSMYACNANNDRVKPGVALHSMETTIKATAAFMMMHRLESFPSLVLTMKIKEDGKLLPSPHPLHEELGAPLDDKAVVGADKLMSEGNLAAVVRAIAEPLGTDAADAVLFVANAYSVDASKVTPDMQAKLDEYFAKYGPPGTTVEADSAATTDLEDAVPVKHTMVFQMFTKLNSFCAVCETTLDKGVCKITRVDVVPAERCEGLIVDEATIEAAIASASAETIH